MPIAFPAQEMQELYASLPIASMKDDEARFSMYTITGKARARTRAAKLVSSVALNVTPNTSPMKSALTNHKPREKGIDPPHNQRLRNHHGHLPLHHAHHPFHSRGVAHRIRSGFPPQLGLSQELSLLEGLHHVCFARRK